VIQRMRMAAPPLYLGAVSAVCAFLGGRFSEDLRLTAQIWAAAAMGAVILSTCLAYHTAHSRRRHEIEVAADLHALSMGRRARSITLDVIARDGSWQTYPLVQVLTDVTPQGRALHWQQPYGVTLYHAEPQLGESDGEAA
jgi:hypothetical protein